MFLLSFTDSRVIPTYLCGRRLEKIPSFLPQGHCMQSKLPPAKIGSSFSMWLKIHRFGFVNIEVLRWYRLSDPS